MTQCNCNMKVCTFLINTVDFAREKKMAAFDGGDSMNSVKRNQS